MKIGINEIIKGIEYTAVQKIANGLKKEGFEVKNNFMLSGKDSIRFDLYAEKGEDKRIYEFKIGKNKIQTKQFEFLQNAAKSLNAKLYIVYLEVPHSKEIEFDGLEYIIYEDLISDIPSELDELSTHTFIDSVDNISIELISISEKTANLKGSATVNLSLQFGSNLDIKNNDGIEDSLSLDFFFKISIDILSNQINKKYYKFDLEKY